MIELRAPDVVPQPQPQHGVDHQQFVDVCVNGRIIVLEQLVVKKAHIAGAPVLVDLGPVDLDDIDGPKIVG